VHPVGFYLLLLSLMHGTMNLKKVTGFFGVLSVFGRRIEGMMRLRSEQVWTCNVTLHVHTCSDRNSIIPLMRRPNNDSTPKKPVTLPRNQLLIR
jgi:hypothetical protein